MDSRLVFSRNYEEEGSRRLLNGYRASFQGDDSVQALDRDESCTTLSVY